MKTQEKNPTTVKFIPVFIQYEHPILAIQVVRYKYYVQAPPIDSVWPTQPSDMTSKDGCEGCIWNRIVILKIRPQQNMGGWFKSTCGL
jgi:hypothetical protein